MRNFFLFLLLITSFTVAGQTSISKREITEVRLNGSGYELGLQHGKLLKTKIEEIVKKNEGKYFSHSEKGC